MKKYKLHKMTNKTASRTWRSNEKGFSVLRAYKIVQNCSKSVECIKRLDYKKIVAVPGLHAMTRATKKNETKLLLLQACCPADNNPNRSHKNPVN